MLFNFSIIRLPNVLLFFCAGRLIAKALLGTSLVITDPDPISVLEPIFRGATSEEFEPINAFSPISVKCFETPSKLQNTVPAPILLVDPTCASPM